ncbi:hypothetical protein EI94DRAFT_1697553 [Lactarius quietus]|nr:hypothetical protein EI94DRAFT_1697553 [Lactarius quietus]
MSSPSISAAVTMPNPRSAEAPYFDDRSNDPITYFLFEYETLATSRGLSDSQKVETIVHYIARHMRDLWNTVDGHSTGHWETFKLTLENLYPDTSAATRYTLRTLQDFVDISARTRMRDEDDVMIYYRRFLTLSNPLVNSREITAKGRSDEFLLGFHPNDREPLKFRLSA